MPRVETLISPLGVIAVKYVRLTSLHVYYRCTLQMIPLWARLNWSQPLTRNLYDVLSTMSYWFLRNDTRGLPFDVPHGILRFTTCWVSSPYSGMPVSSFQRLRFARIFPRNPFELANKMHANREGAAAAARNACIIPGNMRMKIREWGSVASVQPLLPLLLLVHGAMPSSFFPMHFLLLDLPLYRFSPAPVLDAFLLLFVFFFFCFFAKRLECTLKRFLWILVDQRFFFWSNCHLFYYLSFLIIIHLQNIKFLIFQIIVKIYVELNNQLFLKISRGAAFQHFGKIRHGRKLR